jgi:hypothetical protein
MASKAGPTEEERLAPGDTSTNPAGAANDKPANGAEDSAPESPVRPKE